MFLIDQYSLSHKYALFLILLSFWSILIVERYFFHKKSHLSTLWSQALWELWWKWSKIQVPVICGMDQKLKITYENYSMKITVWKRTASNKTHALSIFDPFRSYWICRFWSTLHLAQIKFCSIFTKTLKTYVSLLYIPKNEMDQKYFSLTSTDQSGSRIFLKTQLKR